jgi:N-acetylneuraminate synthase
MTKEKPMVRIGTKEVGNPGYCMVVAEIGINHNGDISLAKKLIDVAAQAGCDAVKFQKRTVSIVYSPEELAKPREVPKEMIEQALARGVLPDENRRRLESEGLSATTNGDQKWALELTAAEYGEIDRYCKEKNILWFASPWDEESVDFLEEFDPCCYKVASASLTDDGLLRHMRSKGRPIILSTGMADLPMISHAVEVLGTDNLVLLHCTSVYPTFQHAEMDRGLSLINLNGIKTLRQTFPGVPIGFSSHDLGILPSYAAAVIGTVMIEKHVTLWRGMYGSDQGASIEPDDLNKLVRAVRDLPVALGDGEIRFYEEEVPVAAKLRRR